MAAGASRAKADWRVWDRGTSISHAMTRHKIIAVAKMAAWKPSFAKPDCPAIGALPPSGLTHACYGDFLCHCHRRARHLVLLAEPMKGDAMKILVAGATGALGKQLVPRLLAAGHQVVGMTRSESKRDALRAMGATPLVADALDPDQVARAAAAATPQRTSHTLTS